MKTLGLISYQFNHLKTEQLVMGFLGRYHIKIYALPFFQRTERKVLLQHRPAQAAAAHPQELCDRFHLEYIPVEKDTDIDDTCDWYLVAGAGILSEECVKTKQIINAHPGVIPAARGLDAFKWSIYHQIPLGVTLHYIDENVDIGKTISISPTPVFSSDTLESLARRHYEQEIQMLLSFEEHLRNPENPFEEIPLRESTRRMKYEVEQEMVAGFDQYKAQFATSKYF